MEPPRKKARQVKTLYERFSHHKVQDLESAKNAIKEKLQMIYLEDIRTAERAGDYFNTWNWNVFDALLKSDIPFAGTFYVSGDHSSKFYSDAYCFREIFEKIRVEKELHGDKFKYLEVKVLVSDFEDGVLVLYRDHQHPYFNLHIIREKDSNVLLCGNIAQVINNA